MNRFEKLKAKSRELGGFFGLSTEEQDEYKKLRQKQSQNQKKRIQIQQIRQKKD